MDENISITTRQDHVIPDDRVLNINEEKNSLSTKYHDSEIAQNKAVIKNSIRMIWVGIFLLSIGLFLTVMFDKNILSLIPGAFVDIFAGTMIHLVNKSSESKQKYFENLTLVEHEERIINLIHKSDNEKFQEEMIAKIVDKHCRN